MGRPGRRSPRRGIGEPFALDDERDAYDAARRAFAEAYGTDASRSGIGGSIPFIAEFARASRARRCWSRAWATRRRAGTASTRACTWRCWARACLAEALLLAELAPDVRS